MAINTNTPSLVSEFRAIREFVEKRAKQKPVINPKTVAAANSALSILNTLNEKLSKPVETYLERMPAIRDQQVEELDKPTSSKKKRKTSDVVEGNPKKRARTARVASPEIPLSSHIGNMIVVVDPPSNSPGLSFYARPIDLLQLISESPTPTPSPSGSERPTSTTPSVSRAKTPEEWADDLLDSINS